MLWRYGHGVRCLSFDHKTDSFTCTSNRGALIWCLLWFIIDQWQTYPGLSFSLAKANLILESVW